MGRYQQKPKVTVPYVPDGTTKLPTERPIAVYYRQSTEAQVGNISTAIQTVDMAEYVKQLGWSEDEILMIDMDAGISGSTKIDERPGMRTLFSLISDGKVGTVACHDEDRLFRDVTQIQVNIFIEACKRAAVLVITPTMIYDFANELTGKFHARQFRFKSEMAAEYIDSVIRGKLHRAKRRLLLEGRWAGAGIPPGFMVDMRKHLPDGERNPEWRRFVPFEPYAEIVNEYFRLFLKHDGYIRETVRHILKHGPYYPDPAVCLPPKGYKAVYRMHRYENGYCPGRTGLKELLTNAAYIGHWAYKDTIVRWNNHPAIVPEDTFMRAFNYISDTSLDGSTNQNFTPNQQQVRPTVDENRPVERPLYAGMIVSKYQNRWMNVGTNWVGPLQHYTYVLWGSDVNDKYVWGRASNYVDEAITGVVQEKLLVTFDPKVWERVVTSSGKEYEQQRKQKEAQLAALTEVMKNLTASLETLRNSNMIRAAEERYEEAQAEYDRLMADLAAGGQEAQLLEQLHSLKDTCGPALENWDNLTRDEKRIVARAFIQRIEATPAKGKALRLVIRWRDGSNDEIVVRSQSDKWRRWLPEETERLRELVDASASQVEIAREFPNRRWQIIRNKIWTIFGKGILAGKSKSLKPIKSTESYNEYVKRTGKKSVTNLSSESRSKRVLPYELNLSRPGWANVLRQPGRHD